MSYTSDTSYDCTPQPKPESIARHVGRTFHNVLHPHHKRFYLAPMTLMCKAPEMATVTVTAASDSPPQPIYPGDEPGWVAGDFGGTFAYSHGTYDGALGGAPQAPLPHATVPEPSALFLMLPALLAIILAARRGAL